MKISAKLKFFLLNLMAAVIVIIVIGVVVLFQLDNYTHHGIDRRTGVLRYDPVGSRGFGEAA